MQNQEQLFENASWQVVKIKKINNLEYVFFYVMIITNKIINLC